MAKSGRPKTPADKVRHPGISIRLTQPELETIQQAAQKSGLRISDWARKCLIYVAVRDIRIA